MVEVTEANGRFRVTIGEEASEVDARLPAQGIYSLLIGGISYVADVKEEDGWFLVDVNGESYRIRVGEGTRPIIRARGGAGGGPGRPGAHGAHARQERGRGGDGRAGGEAGRRAPHHGSDEDGKRVQGDDRRDGARDPRPGRAGRQPRRRPDRHRIEKRKLAESPAP